MEYKRAIRDVEKLMETKHLTARRAYNRKLRGGDAPFVHPRTNHSEFKFMSSEEKGFRRQLQRIVVNNVNDQCARRDKNGEWVAAISKSYVENNMLNRTEYLLWYETPVTEEHVTRRKTITSVSKQINGVLLGHTKTVRGVKMFYVDLLCSRHRKGKALLAQAERVALEVKCEAIALRAAWSKLIPYYSRNGYRRMANHCERPSRAQRASLRNLDKDAVTFRGRTMQEGEGEGWWMSKCLRRA